jgi:hypothetical protein
LCGMEQARRSALAHHVHRTAPMGPRVLINGIWYNGSVAAIRTDGVEPELLVEHIEPEGFRLPITILVLDHAGEVACITIDAERTSFH